MQYFYIAVFGRLNWASKKTDGESYRVTSTDGHFRKIQEGREIVSMMCIVDVYDNIFSTQLVSTQLPLG